MLRPLPGSVLKKNKPGVATAAVLPPATVLASLRDGWRIDAARVFLKMLYGIGLNQSNGQPGRLRRIMKAVIRMKKQTPCRINRPALT